MKTEMYFMQQINLHRLLVYLRQNEGRHIVGKLQDLT